MSRRTALVLCLTLCWLASARAATITVTSDSGGTGGPDCTLRDAITAANTDRATGGCVAGDAADTIELPVDATITLTEPDNDTDGPNGLPSITSEVMINGNGSTVERADGTPSFRIFFVAADGGLTLENLTVSNGSVESAPYSSAGGGIFNAGVLTLTDSTLSNNEGGDFGGGILNINTGTVMLTNTTISGNISSFHGGGIANAGTLTLINSTISGNVTGGPGGGGFWTSGGVLSLTSSTICGNQPDQIDGIYDDGGGNLVVDECPACTSGDLDGDGAVGAADLAILLASWGPCARCPADINDDGQVGPLDLATLLAVWGSCR